MVHVQDTLKTGGIPFYSAFREFEDIVAPGIAERDIFRWFSSRLSHFDNLHINISKNDTVFHGLPRNSCIKDNDLFTIDICGIYQGYWQDSAFTFYTGQDGFIIQAVKDSCFILKKLTELLYPGIPVSEIGLLMASLCIPFPHLSLIKEAAGHGIGKELHEEPEICFCTNSSTDVLTPGNWYCLEPVYSLGESDIEIDSLTGEGHTVDLSPTIHTEVMVYCSEEGISSPVISNFF